MGCVLARESRLDKERRFEVTRRALQAALDLEMAWDPEERAILQTMVTNVESVLSDFDERSTTSSSMALPQADLAQAQRMEAIGRLAGGVAHDFNNLLTVINSFASFIIEDLDDSDPVRADVLEIRDAGRRAAALVRQLLVFSRRQAVEEEVLDVSEIVCNLEKMLRRLLGEDIELIIDCAEDLGGVKADRTQIEQVIVNLAVNARDAMPAGGRLVIEASNVTVDDCASGQGGTGPAEVVLLTVSDSGKGMDRETQRRVFEPFFTTKERGKGTGLGLAMVYGIVTRAGGRVNVESALGHGSTFRVLLPTIDAEASPDSFPRHVVEMRGNETVLIVEDEDSVRMIAERALRTAGYNVLLAPNAGEALLLCEQHEGEIHLLLTDVVLPHTNGKKLADRLHALRPDMCVLFMSGYADEDIEQRGVTSLEAVLFKPFTPPDLVRKAREVLDKCGTAG